MLLGILWDLARLFKGGVESSKGGPPGGRKGWMALDCLTPFGQKTFHPWIDRMTRRYDAGCAVADCFNRFPDIGPKIAWTRFAGHIRSIQSSHRDEDPPSDNSIEAGVAKGENLRASQTLYARD